VCGVCGFRQIVESVGSINQTILVRIFSLKHKIVMGNPLEEA
jgi:hypothetical protein